MADGDETLRLTYAELAQRRGITLAAARRLTQRHRWPKQVGNDGMTRVTVPVSALEKARPPAPPPAVETPNPATDARTDMVPVAVVETLRIQLDRAEATITDLRQRLDASEARIDALLAPRVTPRLSWWRRWRRSGE